MISKHIVAAHGGELVLESRQGAGATVRFTVPLAAG
jgi:signal transduction histidine kinase